MIENRSILVIEGTEFQRTMLARLLESLGARKVVAVATPPGYKGDYDIVFIDSGLAESPGRFRPASIIITGSSKSDEIVAKLIAEDADTFLTKPYTLEGLRLALKELEFARPEAGATA